MVLARTRAVRRLGSAALALVLGAACAAGVGAAPDDPTIGGGTAIPPAAASSSTTSSSTSTTSTTAPAPATVPPETSTTRPHPPRSLHDQPWTPYATAGPVTLHHPADRIEAIGFHESGHDGAQPQAAAASAARWFVQETRDRDTHPQSAADLVIEPDREVRAPVTGRVIRAGTYTLYCDHVDQYAVIEPDARPGWEVKVLHVEGLAVTKGQRVEAGVTRLAARARVLPFPSSVEDDTALPSWPHVHIEVVDPSIPDRATGPGCP